MVLAHRGLAGGAGGADAAGGGLDVAQSEVGVGERFQQARVAVGERERAERASRPSTSRSSARASCARPRARSISASRTTSARRGRRARPRAVFGHECGRDLARLREVAAVLERARQSLPRRGPRLVRGQDRLEHLLRLARIAGGQVEIAEVAARAERPRRPGLGRLADGQRVREGVASPSVFADLVVDVAEQVERLRDGGIPRAQQPRASPRARSPRRAAPCRSGRGPRARPQSPIVRSCQAVAQSARARARSRSRGVAGRGASRRTRYAPSAAVGSSACISTM